MNALHVWPMLLPATGLSFKLLLLLKAPWLSEKRWRRFNAGVYVCVFDPLALLFLPVATLCHHPPVMRQSPGSYKTDLLQKSLLFLILLFFLLLIVAEKPPSAMSLM